MLHYLIPLSMTTLKRVHYDLTIGIEMVIIGQLVHILSLWLSQQPNTDKSQKATTICLILTRSLDTLLQSITKTNLSGLLKNANVWLPIKYYHYLHENTVIVFDKFK